LNSFESLLTAVGTVGTHVPEKYTSMECEFPTKGRPGPTKVELFLFLVITGGAVSFGVSFFHGI
jgi:hypothetical protein